MRTYQIDINITDMSDFASIPNYSKDKDAKPPQIHKYHVYSDSNNFYEALAKAVEGMCVAYREKHGETCGRLSCSIDNKQICGRLSSSIDNKQIIDR